MPRMLAQIARNKARSLPLSQSLAAVVRFGYSHLNSIVSLALFMCLPVLSGCITASAIQQANTSIVTRRYASADRIAMAALTPDQQLCVFFEKDSTNAVGKSQFSLPVPLVLLSNNVQELCDRDFRMRNVDGSYQTRHVSYAVLRIPGNAISKNWPLLKTARPDLQFIPVGELVMRRQVGPAFYHYTDFPLLSNATQTVYLTRTNPIEFVYVDPSLKRSFNVLSIQPDAVTKKQPGCYFLLPITVPLDIATLPVQLPIGIMFWLVMRNGGC